ncbi:MAG: VOC family protein [Acidimicrobiales bacterium]
MVERITARQFQESGGVADWRVLAFGASAWFEAPSHAAGAELVRRIGELADAANHHPDVDLRRTGVHVRLLTHDLPGLSDHDVGLARTISEAARALGLATDPAAVQAVDLAIDTLDAGAVVPFWRTVLAHDTLEEGELVDPHRRWPPIWFQQMDAPRPLRNRIHLDVFVPGEVAAERVAAAVAASGHVTYDKEAPRWVTLADAEGNEADVATWAGYETDLPGDLLTPRQFEQADGVDDWRVLQGASTYYPTASFAQGVELVAAAASLADEAGKPLHADLRYPGVTLRVGTPEDGWLDPGFVELTRRVQVGAHGLGLVADPTVARDLMLTIDALDIGRVRAFWAAALAYSEREDEDLYDPRLVGPAIWFQQMDAPREQRNRIHVDVFVPDDQAQRRVTAAVAAGGRVVYDAKAPFRWTVADPEGNEVDIAVAGQPFSARAALLSPEPTGN